MAVCRFWQTGNCKFGSNCRYEHPRTNDQPRQNHNSYRNQNRFDAFSRDNRHSNENDSRHSSSTLPYRLDKERIQIDLTEDRPIWILSSYSPTPETPRQLFGGSLREQSYEELRLRHYELAAQGQEQQAIQEAQTLYGSAEQQIQTAIRDLDGAVRYIIDGRDDHPNRIDICKEITRMGFYMEHAAASAQPQPTSRFQGSSFGQPSQFLQPQTFGQPSTLGMTNNPFAKNSGMQGSFVKPSYLVSDENSAFTQPRNPFSRVGEASSSSFGNATLDQAASTNQRTTAAMAALSTGLNAFGKESFPGETSVHSADHAAPSSLLSNGSTGAVSHFPQSSVSLSSDSLKNPQKNAQGRLVSWDGKQIFYIDGEPCFRRVDNGWEKVWFPDRPRLDEAEELPASMYSPALEEDYRYIREHGTFRHGLMPDLAPKKAWCNWDF